MEGLTPDYVTFFGWSMTIIVVIFSLVALLAFIRMVYDDFAGNWNNSRRIARADRREEWFRQFRLRWTARWHKVVGLVRH